MNRTYIPTEEDIASLPQTKTCSKCNVSKERECFGIIRIANTKRTYWTFRSACKACDAKKHRKQLSRASNKRIYAEIAPMSAAKKLIERNPQALAVLIQRFRLEYIELLEAERLRLNNIRQNQRNKALETRGKY